ncbi:MAG: 2-amino-4-hydroxy-6-hydroxymethyldihydropteridine diphosphokinase [Planctomycetota bacterium]|jgi:2-amino-4-hydroxy-6-hydroxymethyldihydropteridine diphosphokinase
MPVVRAFIGLGANLGDRETTLRDAVARLGRVPGVRVVRRSRLRETAPEDVPDQPAFLNGVIEVETGLEPRALLDRLLEIETELGRTRDPDTPRRGPRTVDLDLLLYGDRAIDEPGLQVPHPRLREREFVLGPLSEIEPALARRLREEKVS